MIHRHLLEIRERGGLAGKLRGEIAQERKECRVAHLLAEHVKHHRAFIDHDGCDNRPKKAAMRPASAMGALPSYISEPTAKSSSALFIASLLVRLLDVKRFQ